MKKYLIVTILLGTIIIAGCAAQNNDVTDNNDNSDLNPTATPEVSYQTTTCTKNNDNMGVADGTKYIIKHDGENVKNITMKLDYSVNNDDDKEMYDENKSLFTNIADKFQDVVGVTINVIQDTTDMFQAELDLAVDKMTDNDMANFDQFKVSKSLTEQKRNFEEKGLTCE